MNLQPLTVTCPGCGSGEVVYSCHPDCCFNHVCGDCLTNFELFTEEVGGDATLTSAEAGERDSCAPTVACARCAGLSVYQIEGSSPATRLVCASCHALLELKYSFD